MFDVVAEVDFPLGEASDLVYDTWARDLQSKVHEFFQVWPDGEIEHRFVRQAGHLKILVPGLPRMGIGQALDRLLDAVHAQVDGDVVVKIHELEPVQPAPVETMSLEEAL